MAECGRMGNDSMTELLMIQPHGIERGTGTYVVSKGEYLLDTIGPTHGIEWEIGTLGNIY